MCQNQMEQIKELGGSNVYSKPNTIYKIILLRILGYLYFCQKQIFIFILFLKRIINTKHYILLSIQEEEYSKLKSLNLKLYSSLMNFPIF